MTKPHTMSVTSVPCKCGYLERGAKEPDWPIVFDPGTKAFQFKFPTEHGDGSLEIYHCPFCGGAAPKSITDTLFATVSTEETIRLKSILADIKTLDDAIEKFGQADQDLPHGEGIGEPKKRGIRHRCSSSACSCIAAFQRRLMYTSLIITVIGRGCGSWESILARKEDLIHRRRQARVRSLGADPTKKHVLIGATRIEIFGHRAPHLAHRLRNATATRPHTPHGWPMRNRNPHCRNSVTSRLARPFPIYQSPRQRRAPRA
jgi:hypothetical protein